MKKIIYLFLFILLIHNVSALQYDITTVPNCTGLIYVMAYVDNYNIEGCARGEIYFECKCEPNKKIIFNGLIEKKEKIVVEYYTKTFKDDRYRVTNEYFLMPAVEDIEEIKEQAEIKKQALVLSLAVPLGITLILLSCLGYYVYKQYKIFIQEDD